MLDGAVQFHLNLRYLMGSDKGEFCHRFCLMYMDDLSVNLKKCPTGCIAGGTVVNHLMYADDIVLLSPSATGLSLLLHVCGKYGLDHDIRFNSKKSAVIIFRNSSVKDVSFPSFEMNGESIKEMPFVKSWSCYKC